MKINHVGVSGINPYQKQLNKVNGPKKPSGAQADKLEISSAAKEMQGASKILKERQDKIQSLKQQVSSGEYKPNPEGIAKGIVDFYRGK
ncbi:negative regulator of flagellin synthesis FlgM [Bacillus ectoiniformans]|uniref:flagellar biosynthesis anti-sigma factor FlgM n=1 Tax=Bacillus ectoiniformans TaxID=1494429 RepID=UPI001955FF99|nr:flagellar biosynthesis anti-sigma factor FlgM [Bacillus ectoiniformans]MBM7649357.1 negative regulator of flagellin synthesis FlgM [Bacillus ectoiniformans]